MRVEERHRGGGLFGVLELFYAHFQAGDVLPHELRSCLAFSVVVLTTVRLLGTDTLRTGWLCAVTSLETEGGEGSDIDRKGRKG